jgi:CBS domain containing-hemolysin-like protein
MTLLIVVSVVTIFLASTCAFYEAILYSTRSATLEAARASGYKTELASQLLEMKKKIAVPIAALVIMTTLANTAGAFVVGIIAGDVLGSSMVPLFSVLFSLGILFIGEIAPKTLGAVYWRQLWPYVVRPLKLMKYGLYPLILVTQGLSHVLTRGHKAQHITEEEILAMVRMGALEGQISHNESLLVHNIIDLENRPVRTIMTPRTVIFSLNAALTAEEAVKVAHLKGFTRIPIYENDHENVTGYVLIRDLLSATALGNPQVPISSMANPISFVPDTSNLLVLLTSFLKQRRHIAIVVDEYGGVAGLVTLEDLIETLLGDEIVDETDSVVDLQEQARRLRRQRPSS